MRPWSLICRIKKNNRDRRKAFTMVETLVVATLFAVIAVGLATSFFSGIKLWNTAKNVDFSRDMFILDMEAIASALRQSVDVPTIGFEGSSQEISFPALSGNSIYKITYTFLPDEKSLNRKQADVKDVIAGKEAAVNKKIPFAEEVTFSYLYFDEDKQDYLWTDSWIKEKGIFSAVKLEAKFKGERFVKTVFIPVS